jgi:hypothetical protein
MQGCEYTCAISHSCNYPVPDAAACFDVQAFKQTSAIPGAVYGRASGTATNTAAAAAATAAADAS